MNWRCAKRGGFTLLELVIVVSIISILLTLVIPAISPLTTRAQRVVCMGNLRSIYAAESAYLDDYQQWPQVPPGSKKKDIEKFWKETLKPYGIVDRTWICPTFKRNFTQNPSKYSDYPEIHYMPAQFGENPLTPRKWSGMPWAVEIGDFHATGNLLIRADGAIIGMNEIFRQAGGGGGAKVINLK